LLYLTGVLCHVDNEIGDVGKSVWENLNCSQVLGNFISSSIVNLMAFMQQKKPIDLQEAFS
jgi:hypothetical protein